MHVELHFVSNGWYEPLLPLAGCQQGRNAAVIGSGSQRHDLLLLADC